VVLVAIGDVLFEFEINSRRLSFMLDELHNFLENNGADLFAFIENSRRPINLYYDNNIFARLLECLAKGFQSAIVVLMNLRLLF
jgi:hypothetical protein